MAHSQLRVRDSVYFFANSPAVPEHLIMCRGYIARCPTAQSKCYKVIVTDVSLAHSSSLSYQQQEFIADSLLGKKIPRDENQLHPALSGAFGQIYLASPWKRLSDAEKQKVVSQIKKSRGKQQ